MPFDLWSRANQHLITNWFTDIQKLKWKQQQKQKKNKKNKKTTTNQQNKTNKNQDNTGRIEQEKEVKTTEEHNNNNKLVPGRSGWAVVVELATVGLVLR